jgi:hypothetical protein
MLDLCGWLSPGNAGEDDQDGDCQDLQADKGGEGAEDGAQ